MNHPDQFLRLAHRRARLGLLAWALALAALAWALQLATFLAWLPSTPPAVVARWALVVASAFTLALWIRRSRRLSPVELARRIDAEWGLSSRLESSAELEANPSAFAAAQRADVAARLGARPTPRAPAWFASLGLLALVALFLLAELCVLGVRRLAPAASASSSLAATSPAALDISADLLWQSPESEIKATAIEEVPLAALASSVTGFKTATLEIAVNGLPRLSRPLDAAALARLAKPGEHPLELDLYLDEVGAQEFDLVSYHLRAERATAAPSPAIVSPLQFIQIRPPREDVARGTGVPGSSLDRLATLLGNLKAAQLQLLKQNFLLAHAPLDHALPAWREENARVAADQKVLAQKTSEARDYAIAEALPALAVDNLGQCIPLMNTAAEGIAAAANEPAARPQGQALGLLVSAEKLIRKIIVEADPSAAAVATPPPPKNHDPFKDKQQFKLPPRAQTPAGQLEALAQAQTDAAQGAPSDSAKKDPLAEQADLARRLATLADSRALVPAAQTRVEQAAKDAAEAARQLAQHDAAAARAPAAAAAQALREAAAAQDEAGRAIARAELEKLRREINAAERQADPAARATALAEVAEKLRAEASAQQQTGSAEAARQLADAAAKIDQAARHPPPSDPGRPPADDPTGSKPASSQGEGQREGKPGEKPPADRPDAPPGSSASQAAARAQAALTPRDQALARAARQLAAGAGSGQTDGTPAEALELGAQLASELISSGEALGLARKILDQTRPEDRAASDLVLIPDDLRDDATRLVALLEAARQAGRRDEQVRRFNPDDFDPAYRPAVEAYFEKLSRDAAK